MCQSLGGDQTMLQPTRRTRAIQRPILFLDFEASSLLPGSWPVEIGYAWFADGRVETRAVLIAPRADWSADAWCPDAEQIHGLTLQDLEAGASADAVAAETDVFAHFEVVSDNHVWDQRWLDRLRGDRPRIEVRPLRAAMRERLDDDTAGAMAQTLFRSTSPHRAAGDAARLAEAWLGATCAYGVAA